MTKAIVNGKLVFPDRVTEGTLITICIALIALMLVAVECIVLDTHSHTLLLHTLYIAYSHTA